jgi:hypothetical protein
MMPLLSRDMSISNNGLEFDSRLETPNTSLHHSSNANYLSYTIQSNLLVALGLLSTILRATSHTTSNTTL